MRRNRLCRCSANSEMAPFELGAYSMAAGVPSLGVRELADYFSKLRRSHGRGRKASFSRTIKSEVPSQHGEGKSLLSWWRKGLTQGSRA